MKNIVEIKGTKEGLTVILDKNEDFEVIKASLDSRFSSHRYFFNTPNTHITFKGRKLNCEQYNQLKELVESYGFKTSNENHEKRQRDELTEGMVKIVKGTVRSGQKVEYAGNVVILGDVNPGGEVIASGNIIVMGIVRGLVHAGSDGNRGAIVVGFRLQPIQIRIADVMSRAPDDAERPLYPEYAYVKDDRIFIEKL
ncbi:septum site-determining protein MinC [Caldanaerobius polysaccharolyticus]|uniref:septum site-determining protein MinC n=1 Tax=Caldanaerobius polysaccharolyticus TaxID=44256 RepID=UPI00047D22D5|nr:septum site-determining protein MinC [Caldanaerobius polysaccharolyticus]